MANKWITAAPGIRYRQHKDRKHGARLDRHFTLRFSVDGKQVEEALGWTSEGWTVALAQEELSKLPFRRALSVHDVMHAEIAQASRLGLAARRDNHLCAARQAELDGEQGDAACSLDHDGLPRADVIDFLDGHPRRQRRDRKGAGFG